ncbi:MAG: hypothetical protein LBP22_09125 [Deltaproteobacteria bacterium]|nr:hypothetical protein [Deltaproteobacteria bacterium]
MTKHLNTPPQVESYGRRNGLGPPSPVNPGIFKPPVSAGAINGLGLKNRTDSNRLCG